MSLIGRRQKAGQLSHTGVGVDLERGSADEKQMMMRMNTAMVMAVTMAMNMVMVMTAPKA